MIVIELKLIESEDFRSFLVRVCIEAIWNILEVGGKEIIDTIACEEIVVSLKKTFERVINEGYKLDDKVQIINLKHL
jgi:hypothetical protein